MTEWAATPELSLNVYKIIEEIKPALIVELGSGVTTIVSAYSLEKFHPDGRIISFDHDADFTHRTRTELSYHQLTKFAHIHDTSLTDLELNNQKYIWYDIDSSQIQKSIDLLIIDGPPLKTQKNARYPALPFFYSKLSKNAVLIFHDTHRDTESKTVTRWLDEFPDFEHSTLRTEKGITIFRRIEKS